MESFDLLMVILALNVHHDMIINQRQPETHDPAGMIGADENQYLQVNTEMIL
jgi:hypothetical protein